MEIYTIHRTEERIDRIGRKFNSVEGFFVGMDPNNTVGAEKALYQNLFRSGQFEPHELGKYYFLPLDFHLLPNSPNIYRVSSFYFIEKNGVSAKEVSTVSPNFMIWVDGVFAREQGWI